MHQYPHGSQSWCFTETETGTPLRFVSGRDLPELAVPHAEAWLRLSGFDGSMGDHLLLPDADGAPAEMLAGIGDGDPADPASYALAVRGLPAGTYRLIDADAPCEAIAIGWALGSQGRGAAVAPMLGLPAGLDRRTAALADMDCWARDLINRPGGALGPDELAREAERLAERHGARLVIVRGEALLAQDLPGIFAVGKGGVRPPLLIDLRWGDPAAPRVTLVGKGVCFDAGGLDLKRQPEIAMMKSDMAGAAHVLALASLVMEIGLDISLRALIPAVDNLPSATSVMPGDVLRNRNGRTIEIANTDYEGRVLLADALALAAEEEPALLIDFASLTTTGLGPDIAALFARRDETGVALLRAAADTYDAMCRLPLHAGYRRSIRADAAPTFRRPNMAFRASLPRCSWRSSCRRRSTGCISISRAGM
ncbi:leucyl aminopeptidase family protein [Sphingomonas colocasiae]|uniref:Leucyl aminopeptidase family protein n=1 Tax=Sphingomonas colocasiae TaxID=1848973 RepID=A0ABS7PTA9_9SPHN|nr:leucyl aminopeptidase family protein [Sphingomonas colocasiae]MBY8824224.1 leucyl aminopeptidase family protein [Sphingomonas colocasiae]